MRRTAITGAIVLAISTTAVVALAGTAPSMDAPDRVPTTVQGQQFDTPVVQNMERTQTVSTVWTRDGIAHDQDMIWDRDQDMDTTHNQDMIWDRDQDMDATHNQDMDTANNQDMTNDHDQDMDTANNQDMTNDHDQDMDTTHNQDMMNDSMWRSTESHSWNNDH